MAGVINCIKYLLFVFNFLFFLTGCGLLGLGVWLNVEKDDWSAIADYNYISIANACIATGAIVVIISFLGCCGAITSNKCMLLVFFIFLLIVFILEFVSGIIAYQMRGTIDKELKNEILKRVPTLYNKEHEVKVAMDAIQEHFECCGVDAIEDWKGPAPNKDDKDLLTQVPESCCKVRGKTGYNSACATREYEQAMQANVKQQYNLAGCYSEIKDFLRDFLLYLGVVGVVLAIFQIIGLAFSMCLYCAIRKQTETV